MFKEIKSHIKFSDINDMEAYFEELLKWLKLIQIYCLIIHFYMLF